MYGFPSCCTPICWVLISVDYLKILRIIHDFVLIFSKYLVHFLFFFFFLLISLK